jgi:hypothetical protein
MFHSVIAACNQWSFLQSQVLLKNIGYPICLENPVMALLQGRRDDPENILSWLFKHLPQVGAHRRQVGVFIV